MMKTIKWVIAVDGDFYFFFRNGCAYEMMLRLLLTRIWIMLLILKVKIILIILTMLEIRMAMMLLAIFVVMMKGYESVWIDLGVDIGVSIQFNENHNSKVMMMIVITKKVNIENDNLIKKNYGER